MNSTDIVDLESSDFSSRIGTNYGATDDEVQLLKELLAAPTAKLSKLQEEIDRVSAQLDELYSQHRVMFRKVEAHRALMSPIRRIPIDIIREIFLHCLPTQHNPIMSRYHSPVLLTQVCSSWRHIAHSTPLLWSSIYIVVPCQLSNPHFFPSSLPRGSPSPRLASAVEAAQKRAIGITHWLARAAECPLDIVIYDRDRCTSESAYDIILTAVIPFSRRWRSIHFQSPSNSLSRVAALPESDVPMLRSLTIRGQDMPTLQYPGLDQDGFPEFKFLINSGLLRAPQLREMIYTRVTEDFLRFPLKWDQLTVLSLTGCAWTAPEYLSLTKVVQILQRCVALVKCTFEISLPPGGVPASSIIRPVELHSLESISLQTPRVDLALLFQALDVPALRELEFYINPGHVDDGTFVEEVISFLRRTSPTLVALTTDPFFLDKASLHKCLRHCPGLRSLSLRPSHFPGYELWTPPVQHTGLHDDLPVFTVDDDLLSSFIDEDNPVLEMLESFECTVDGNLSDDALLSFVKAKQSGMSFGPLKKVAATLRRPQMLPMASELRQYVQRGLDCRLVYNPSFSQGPFPASEGIFNEFPHRPWGLLSFDTEDESPI